jgi:acyl-homoserine lactone acylase PvdQ
MAYHEENFRGINAQRVIQENSNYTLDKVIAAGYDRRLTAFELLIPALIKAFENTNTKTDYSYLNEAIKTLKEWDHKCGENSVATTLAVHYGELLIPNIIAVKIPGSHKASILDKARIYAAEGNPMEMMAVFAVAYESLIKKYGSWNIPWGQINRYQRISGDIDNKYDDTKPSLPMGFTSSSWGTLPSYVSQPYAGTKNRYGNNGNSFICVVEFGKKVQARSLLAGGQSGDPSSRHFFDQGEMYTRGEFKPVYFYKDDVKRHMERIYHP